MKKNKKSVPTEKKFWIISIAVGICLVVLSVCFFSNADKEKKEANLLDTVNYVKVSMGVVRTTYLIDEQGIIIKANDKVKAADDPENMLKELA